ncbi:hypothetical protein [Flavobacterium sp. W20_MBD1_R3]|uniref:hypothetical protein n=1 Tax=Flavobacterium sp. W20_MBD1_R3 TaxID=3240278 RepID=UPI003F8E0D92
MKKILILLLSAILFLGPFVYGQSDKDGNTPQTQKRSLFLESGINASLPVHIQMYRSHRLAIGVNARLGKKISKKGEIGIRFDYDYRFIKKNSRILTPESTLEERALRSNFSLFSLKPNVQFYLNRNWYWGVESGIGYALSDEDPKIGLGFISEYASEQPFGLCSGLYLGKRLSIGPKKNKIGISMDFTQFLARGHAENSLGLRINYRFIN